MRILRRAAVALALLLLVAVVVVYGLAAASLPPTEGTTAVAGLAAPVEIARDDRGVPTITADSWTDAYFGLGFAHAQDRLFQLDMRRRIASGRLAEILGGRALGIDRHMRVLGLTQAAQSSLAVLSPDTRAALEAYAAGINAGRASLSMLPPEYLVLGVDFEPWRPLDSLLFSRVMALRLSGNWREEAVNAALAEHLGEDGFSALMALSDTPGPTTIPAETAGLGPPLLRLAADWPTEIAPTTASNWWLVEAERSTGGALLANDPHLELQAPIQWYLATLRTPQGTVAGGTIPAIPFHLVGHNGHLAWGLTTTHSDTADLVVETLADGGYRTPEGVTAITERTETIAVAGQSPDRLVVRETRHGPVVSDLVDLTLPNDKVVTLEAAALAPDDRTADAARALTLARTWEEAVAALQDFDAPQQNVALALADGTIGFVSPGRVPDRGQGQGLLPRPGHLAAWDWRGWLPFDALPHRRGEPSGTLVNANNRPVPEDWPAFLGATFPPPFRASRIAHRLAEQPAPSAEAMAALQLDVLSPPFAALRPHLEALPPSHARDRLLAWNGRMEVDETAPLLYAAFLSEAQAAVFADDLGTAYDRWGGHRVAELLAALDDPTGRWCAAPGCGEALATALRRAADSVPEDMAWGEAHRARLTHPLFRHVPGLRELTALDVAGPGGGMTVNRAGYPGGPAEAGPERRFADVHGPGLRMVVDMDRPQEAGFVIATGQSGHPLSPHYGDQVGPWLRNDLRPLSPPGDEAATLRLEPLRSTR